MTRTVGRVVPADSEVTTQQAADTLNDSHRQAADDLVELTDDLGLY